MFGRDVLVTELRHLAFGAAQHFDEAGRGPGVTGGLAGDGGQVAHRVAGALLDSGRSAPSFDEHGGNEALVLFEQCDEQVRRGDFGVLAGGGEPLGGGDRLL